jgi:hypothetical protein
LYTLRFKEKEKRASVVAKAAVQSREVYSGSRLLADLNFQSVSGLYKNFTRISPSEFEIFSSFDWRKNIGKERSFRESHFCSRKVGTDAANGDSYVSLQYVFKISQFLPCNWLFNFNKMHWVLWVTY